MDLVMFALADCKDCGNMWKRGHGACVGVNVSGSCVLKLI